MDLSTNAIRPLGDGDEGQSKPLLSGNKPPPAAGGGFGMAPWLVLLPKAGGT